MSCEKRFEKTKVIVVTAYSKIADKLRDEADQIVIKPIVAKKLSAMIVELVG